MSMRGINLIPADRRLAQERRRRFSTWICVVSIWAGLALATCFGVRLSYSSGAAAAAASELPGVQNQIATLNAKIAAIRKQLSEAQVVQQTAITVTDQPDWSILLSILGSAINDDVVLREISLKPGNTQKKQYLLEMHGLSRTQPAVSQMVLKLQQVGLFDEVKLLRTGREPVLNTSAISFDVSCEIREVGKGNQP